MLDELLYHNYLPIANIYNSSRFRFGLIITIFNHTNMSFTLPHNYGIKMKHVCYHILSDLHNEFMNSIEEIKTTTAKWLQEGDGHFHVYKLSAEEVEPDEILLDEELVSIDEISKNN